MKEKNGILKTTIILNDEETNVFGICREFDRKGEEIILIIQI